MPRQRYVLVLAATTQEAHVYAKRVGLPRFTYRAVVNSGSVRGIRSADVHILPGFKARRDRHSILAELRYGPDIQTIDVEMPPEPQPDPAAVDPTSYATPEEALEAQRDALESTEGWFRETPEALEALEAEVAKVDRAEKDAAWLHDLANDSGTLSVVYEEGELALSRETFVEIVTEAGMAELEDEPNKFEHPERRAAFLRGDALTEETDGTTPGTTESREDAAPDAPKRRRRTRCKTCGELVFDVDTHTAAEHSSDGVHAESFF